MVLLSGPNISGNEWKYVKECLDTEWVSSVGSYVDAFEKKLVDFTGAKFAVATSSGTTALHISLLLNEIAKNDYVIVPNVTFIASVNSIKYVGADPILVDVDPNTWQMDLNLLESYLEKNTYQKSSQCYLKETDRVIKAIMPVHVLGNMCNLDHLLAISKKYNIVIIEDSTESLGSYFKGRHTGTFGKLGCFSFNGNKIITTGGGGMIVTNDEDHAARAKHITTQAKKAGMEYFHDEVGYNYRLVNVLAAIGVAQMEQLPKFLERKKQVKDIYFNELRGVGDIKFQSVEKDVEPNWWMFTVQSSRKEQLLNVLNQNKLQSRPLWVPMNRLPMFCNDTYISNNDYSHDIYKTCLSIPCSTNIKDEELERVITIINEQF